MDSNKKLKQEELTIAQIVRGLPRLKVFDAEFTKFEENNWIEPEFEMVDKNTYIGVEMEIENCREYIKINPYWTTTDDGSLRHYGAEFLTPPIRAWRIENALKHLFNDLNKDVEFSERTSVHIHMNVRTLTIKQLQVLLLTYILFEKTLFHYVGQERYRNVFCVPLVETTIGQELNSLFQYDSLGDTQWHKYTACNLLPIYQKGTLEFRHMHGTGDIKKIITWINFLLSLKKFALRNDPSYIWHRIETLNTTSEYRNFGEEVFGRMFPQLYNENYTKQIASCVTYIKVNCINNRFKQELLKSSKPKFDINPRPIHPTTWATEFEQSNQLIPIPVWTETNTALEEDADGTLRISPTLLSLLERDRQLNQINERNQF